jgi:diguanylate cyclase (GGDEF)-like protein
VLRPNLAATRDHTGVNREVKPPHRPDDKHLVSARPDNRPDDVVAAVLPIFVASMAAVCLGLVLADLTLLPPVDAAVPASAAGCSVLALSGLAALAHLGWARAHWAHPLTVVALLVVAGNADLALGLTADPRHTLVTMLAVVAAGVGLVDSRWFTGCLVVIWSAWLLVVAAAEPSDWAPYVAGLGLAAVLAVGLHLVRQADVRVLRQIRDLADAAAVRDPLTGLANRRGVAMLGAQIVETARRQGDAVHCVFVDVDEFRRVNDSAGREAGDEVLVAVSGALRAVTRGTDVVGRWGGDEFCVVGPGPGMSPMELERRIRDRLLVHEAVDADVWDPRVSAGSAMLAPWDAGSLETVLGKAGQEMRQRRILRRQDSGSTGPGGVTRRTSG